MTPVAYDEVLAPPLAERFGRAWWIGIALSLVGVALLLYGLQAAVFEGMGAWGTNIPYVWGFDLASYGWWIGIANGSALFAAILVLVGVNLHTAINRFAIGLALGAAICAAIFPVFHLGFPWRAYWMIPYPTAQGLWPQFRSPITWDFWNILIYLTVIALLWYVGLIPDLATLRDRAKERKAQIIYGFFALGWRGSARHWVLHQRAHQIVALTLIPLLLVAQTIVAFETLATLVPAWHDTREPLHYVVSGLLSGLAMLLLMAHALRIRLRLGHHIDLGDLDLLAKLLLAAALAFAYVQLTGWVMTWMGEEAAREALLTRLWGPYGFLLWLGLLLAVVPAQLLWWRRLRSNAVVAMAVSLLALAGTFLDHLSIIVAGLQRDWIGTAPASYAPNAAEVSLLVGTVGLFALMVLLSVRRLPIVGVYGERAAEVEAIR